MIPQNTQKPSMAELGSAMYSTLTNQEIQTMAQLFAKVGQVYPPAMQISQILMKGIAMMNEQGGYITPDVKKQALTNIASGVKTQNPYGGV